MELVVFRIVFGHGGEGAKHGGAVTGGEGGDHLLVVHVDDLERAGHQGAIGASCFEGAAHGVGAIEGRDGHAATGAVITKRTGEDLALVGFPADQFPTVHPVLIDPVSVQHVVFGGFAPVHNCIGEVVAGNPPGAVRPIPRARVGRFVDLGQGGFDRGAEPFQIEVSEFAGDLVAFPLVHDVQGKPEVFAGGSVRPAPDGPNVRPDAVLVVIARGDHSVPQFDVFESGVVGGDGFVPFIDAVWFAEIGPEESDAFLEDVFGRFKFSRDIRIKKCANAL